MKSTINRSPRLESYPRLMEGLDTGNVILMHSHGQGTVVFVGDNSRGWVLGDANSFWTMETFKPFNGQVVLEN